MLLIRVLVRVYAVVSLAVVLVVSLTEAKLVQFEHCGSLIQPVGKVVQVDITPCESEPCVFHQGDNVTAKITFIPEEVVTNGILEIVAILPRGERLPWPLKNPFACKGHNLDCPLKAKEPSTAVITMNIEEVPGTYKVVAEVYMGDTVQQNYVFCLKMPVQVTK